MQEGNIRLEFMPKMQFMNAPFLEVEGPTVVVATSMILHSYASSIIINDETSI